MVELNEQHPWGDFLNARTRVIHWMRNEMGYSDEKIAVALSMDRRQVFLIRNSPINYIREVKNDTDTTR